MGLDNIPNPYPCTGKETTIRTIDDKLDCNSMIEKKVCPFYDSNHAVGILGTNCWYRGKVIAYELEALGHEDLSDEFYQDKENHELPELKSELESILKNLESLSEEEKKNLKGFGWNGHFENGKMVWETYSKYEDITNEFKDVINWLKILIENECGFRAWY